MPISKGLLATTGFLVLAPLATSQRESARSESRPLDLTPMSQAGPYSSELVPVLAGGFVLISTTLRIHAFDAASGELAWSSELPAGWDEIKPGAREQLWAAVDRPGQLVAPAASSRIVVAALQVPLSRGSGQDWNGILLDPLFPERRLFAFDLASGRPLWNHEPPPEWDRQSGPFPQRMNVCASPLVVGERVLAPCTSDRSSIDYHIACYALDTGALLWTTFVLRGQTERGMFGQQDAEFVAAPLVASPEGTRVLAQTGLGRLVALAFHDGAVLWSTDYDPIPVPKARSYQAPPRVLAWRTAPPLVAGELLWATPRDGNQLLAIELSGGVVRASVPVAELRALAPAEVKLGLDHLVGVVDGLVLLGGKGVAAFQRDGDPAHPGPWRLRWARAGDRWGVRARLHGGELLLPGPTELVTFDPLAGAERARYPLRDLLGLAVTDSELIGVDRRGLVIDSR